MSTQLRAMLVRKKQPVDNIGHVHDEIARDTSADPSNLKARNIEAQNATNREHDLSLKDSLKLYPKAVVFSLLFSTAIIMEGYDLSLLGSFYGYKSFQEKYGDQVDATGAKIISAHWQTSIQNAGQCGQIVGLYVNGWLSEAIGYKKTMIGSQILMIAAIFIPFFAKNIQTILAGNVVLGLPWGVFQTLTTAYASDVAPTRLRPYLTTYVNLCWVIGQLIASGVIRGLVDLSGEWSYRIPFALQWFWPPLIIVGTVFAPESPWWLLRKDRAEDAREALLSLTRRDCGVHFDVDEQLSLLKATNDLEAAASAGTSYWDCFTAVNLRRTEIACLSYLVQTLCGTALMGYSVQFYQRAGLSETNAFNFNIGQSSMGLVGTLGSWWLMGRLGRRTIYLCGLAVLLILLLVVGGLGFAKQNSSGPAYAIGTLLMIYTFVYDFTLGPVCYALVAEMSSTRLKIKTIVLARNLGNIVGFMNNGLMPNMLGPNAWNWGAKTGLFWAAFCLAFLVWAWFRLPEPNGRTYAELDLLFAHKVSARKFASTKIDEFSGEHTAVEDTGKVD